MAFSRYFLLAVATVLIGMVSSIAIDNIKVDKFLAAKKKFDLKSEIGGDGNLVILLGKKAIENIESYANSFNQTGNVGQALKIMTKGFENTITMVADTLDEGFKSFDSLIGKDIVDKPAAVSEVTKKMNHVQKSILDAGIPFHSCLGAAKSVAGIADKAGFKDGIQSVQDTGTELFENVEVAQFLALQGLKSKDKEVSKRCFKAAHATILSAAAEAVSNLYRGAKTVIQYLTSTNDAVLKEEEPMQSLVTEATKEAADQDPDTKAVLQSLNKEFDEAKSLGIDTSILDELKEGIAQFIKYSALSVAIINDALVKAKDLAKTDPDAAVRLIHDSVEPAKSALIQGSVKAYEGIGSVGSKTNAIEKFNDAIEVAEITRVDGTRAIDAYARVAARGVLSGGEALDKAYEASHGIIQASEARIFEQLQDIITSAFNLVKSGAVKLAKA